ncbi:MAG: hypothetical protein JRG89_00690 [Deltaproteobacteria bacterium]|nr:hypothetical protein [Deltaproteobacteria bacterium]MBW2386927.1 hypothetical protein [Deltaproteobacteria bacterium]MBW2725477.1 hypothetical protein [Deltaproteobacteria bacterium]
MGRIWIGVIFVALLLQSGTANALQFSNWRASQGPALATFSDVAIVSGNRVFAGYEFDPFTFSISATAFTATGFPGSSPMTAADLGLTFFSSAGTSLEANGLGGYLLTAVQVQPNAEVRSFIYGSFDLGNPVQVFGAGPTFNPWVSLNGINGAGTAAGDEAASLPLVATTSGFSNYLDIGVSARLTSVDSSGTLFGGFSEPVVPGGVFTPTVISDTGALLLQDVVEGSVEDLEGRYVVGTSEGLATYWKEVAGDYFPKYIRDNTGTRLAGSLLAIDHSGVLIAAGHLDDGRVIVVDLKTGTWVDVEPLLAAVVPGTLLEIVGITVSGTELALAANSVDFVGYDITATVLPDGALPIVPGPGLLTVPLLLIVGVLAVRKRCH